MHKWSNDEYSLFTYLPRLPALICDGILGNACRAAWCFGRNWSMFEQCSAGPLFKLRVCSLCCAQVNIVCKTFVPGLSGGVFPRQSQFQRRSKAGVPCQQRCSSFLIYDGLWLHYSNNKISSTCFDCLIPRQQFAKQEHLRSPTGWLIHHTRRFVAWPLTHSYYKRLISCDAARYF